MKNSLLFLLIFSFVYIFNSCTGDDIESPTVEWLIPNDEVRDGGPGKDGIPSIDHPNFAQVSTIDFLNENDLVIGIRDNNDIKTYPHPILDWHEIVNDDVGNKHVTLTYCPLTGTAVGWNREINNVVTTFGVSGLLYNSNLIPYDRKTGSNWSQIRLDCVNGELIGNNIELYQVVETTWATWKKWYPNAQVLTTDTGFNRQYGDYPYGGYRDNRNLIFPISKNDDRLHPKERVLGVIADKTAKVYTFNSFTEPTVIKDTFKGNNLIIAGSQADNYIVAFLEPSSDLTFSAFSNSQHPNVIMKDSEGNEWDIFGKVIVGPRLGENLEHVPSFIGYWFSWAAFYEETEIY